MLWQEAKGSPQERRAAHERSGPANPDCAEEESPFSRAKAAFT